MSKVTGNKRVLVSIVLGIVLVIGGATGYFIYAENAKKEAGKTNVAVKAESVGYLPGTSDSKEYNELEETKNKEDLQNALNSGESNVPSIVNNSGTFQRTDIFEELEKPVVKEEKKEPEVRVETQIVEKIVYRDSPPQIIEKVIVKPVQIQPQPQSQEVEEQLSQAESQALDDAFSKLKSQLGSNNVVTYQEPRVYQAPQTAKQTVQQTAPTTEKKEKTATIVRAGTMVPGEIITAIDTDTLGVVVAEITTGPLRGARVLGTVTNAPTDVTDYMQKVSVEFTKLAIAGHDRTYTIKASVLDDETSLPAIADDVDNHYFYRFGLKAVASFVEGFGNAFESAGKTTTTSMGLLGPQTSQTDNNTEFDSRTAAKRALGKVGSTFGQELARMSDRPATIYVNNGKAITILFEADF